jgi:hypothetical protein
MENLKGMSKKEEIEAYALIDDLRAQVKDLSKSNSGLKNKLSFFKTLHEAETRKRTPYDHIPPRVVTVCGCQRNRARGGPRGRIEQSVQDFRGLKKLSSA